MPDVDDPSFVAELAWTPGAVLVLHGSADSTVTAPLGVLLGELHRELLARRATEVVVDMVGVELMIASCVTGFVTWIETLQELAPAQRYRIRMRTNASIPWQKHGLAALSCFDTELVKIES